MPQSGFKFPNGSKVTFFHKQQIITEKIQKTLT